MAFKSKREGNVTQKKSNRNLAQEFMIEEYTVEEEPFYVPVTDEVEMFEAAYKQRIPVLLKGPTGCGKTRFVEHMAWRLGRPVTKIKTTKTNDDTGSGLPLITIACHEDLTASDLVGRYLLEGEETKWIDGPLTRAVRAGAICYLDEVVEARKDTTVLIHPLTDHRRLLPIEKRGQVVQADDGFLLCMSYNPGYQSALKDLKHSTRQRFVALEFDYPDQDSESKVIAHESGVDSAMAESLARLGEKVRNLKDHGLQEGASTRLLIYAGKLIKHGIPPRRACQSAVVWGVTDDQEVQKSITEVIMSIFE
ncbi:MAG: CbbQ/NirQ/NorQ/GpvN family protein [SAR202 cluster bacterium]|nr:AAA family ATPase [Chloroflexota bacterium]MQG50553.1 CbbQ/NirQ/NorQ/GpvN family protein [SAR202 cluster bacterium]